MLWNLVGAGLGLGAGLLGHDEAVEQEKRDADLAATTQQYSYITGNKAGPIRRAGSKWGAALGGLTGGLALGGDISNAMGSGASKAVEGASNAANKNSMYANVLGAQDKANQLGEIGKNLTPISFDSAPSFGSGSKWGSVAQNTLQPQNSVFNYSFK